MFLREGAEVAGVAGVSKIGCPLLSRPGIPPGSVRSQTDGVRWIGRGRTPLPHSKDTGL